MNEETLKLIRDLAEKLGTTSEQLWSVLVRQAPINAAEDLIILIGLWVLTCLTFRFCKKAYAEYMLRDEEIKKRRQYGGADVSKAIISGMVGACVFASAVVTTICCTYPIITGLFNPQFWALKQLMP